MSLTTTKKLPCLSRLILLNLFFSIILAELSEGCVMNPDSVLAHRARDQLSLDDDDDARPAPSSASLQGPSGLLHRCFSEQTNDLLIHYQILDVGRQLYIWVSAGAKTQDHLHAAIRVPQVRLSPSPSAVFC